MPHPCTLTPDKLYEQCDVKRLRRSGPGGQHRNKVETAVLLTHRPTQIQAEANEKRSQADNRRAALSRLRVNLALEVRGELSTDHSPSELWQTRCRNQRISVNREHVDFATLLAEALDTLQAFQWSLPETAGRLDCTTSQLLKFLKQEPRALGQLNAKREEQGLHPMK